MQTANGTIFLENAVTISSPKGNFIEYTDSTGMRFSVPLCLVIRLYEIAQATCKNSGNDWEVESARLINLSGEIRSV